MTKKITNHEGGLEATIVHIPPGPLDTELPDGRYAVTLTDLDAAAEIGYEAATLPTIHFYNDEAAAIASATAAVGGQDTEARS